MKTLITLALICFGLNLGHGQLMSTDDQLHFAAGAVISSATYAVTYSTTKNKKKAFWFSLGTSALAGLAKEVYDSGQDHNRFNTKEFVFTTLGGLTASTVLHIFVGRKKKKNSVSDVALVN